MTKSFKMRLEILLLKFFGHLPLLASRILARVFSTLLWYSNSNIRKITTININLCFPELSQQQRDKMIKQSVLESIRTGLEIPMAWLKPVATSFARIEEVEGNELVNQAIADNKGVILLIPHLGHWEYLALYLGTEFQSTNLFKPPKNPELLKIMEKGRNACGCKSAPTNKKGVMTLIKTLKAAGVIGILPDQVPEQDSGCEYAPFYTQQAATMTLMSKLLQRTNSVAIGCFVQRLDNANFKIIFKPADPLVYEKDIKQSVLGINRSVEQLVNLVPTQYQWEYKRFKKGPEGRRTIYD